MNRRGVRNRGASMRAELKPKRDWFYIVVTGVMLVTVVMWILGLWAVVHFVRKWW